MGQCCLYIAVCAGQEDILKLGMGNDPWQRWQAFHRRWFEFFDLERSVVIEFDSRREAQAEETRLHRLLREHNAPMPLTGRDIAGGASEWYRGARPILEHELGALEALGLSVWRDARQWLRPRMQAEEGRLHTLVDHALAADCSGLLRNDERSALRDLVDAHLCLHPVLLERLPAGTSAILDRRA